MIELALERTVAVKVMAPWLVEDEAARRRFVRESRLAASIEHANVIPIHAAGEHDGRAYIAMRYVEGSDLRALIRREGRLEPERAARIVAQVAAGLDAAHRAGLVHRDVKPANILLDSEEHAYLTDFGLTRGDWSSSGPQPTESGVFVGTSDYVAPAQIRGGTVGARADVYSLGAVLHHALTGEAPFAGRNQEAILWAHLTEPPPSATPAPAPDGPDRRIASQRAAPGERAGTPRVAAIPYRLPAGLERGAARERPRRSVEGGVHVVAGHLELLAAGRQRGDAPRPARDGRDAHGPVGHGDEPHGVAARSDRLSRLFCDARLCFAVVGGALVHRDVSHMTTVFGTTLGTYLLEALA